MRNDEETWESLQLASGVYTVGDPIPEVKFDFYIDGVSETNVYCSNAGIEKQIKKTLELNPARQKIVYFFYERIRDESSSS